MTNKFIVNDKLVMLRREQENTVMGPRFWIPRALYENVRLYLEYNSSTLRSLVHTAINTYSNYFGNNIPSKSTRNEFLVFGFGPKYNEFTFDRGVVDINLSYHNKLFELSNNFETSPPIMLTNIILHFINSYWDKLAKFKANSDFSKDDLELWIKLAGYSNQHYSFSDKYQIRVSPEEYETIKSRFTHVCKNGTLINKIDLKILVNESIEYFNALEALVPCNDEPKFTSVPVPNYKVICPRVTDEIINLSLTNKIGVDRIVRLYINHIAYNHN